MKTLDPSAHLLRVAQMAAEYAFGYRLAAGSAGALEWIVSNVAELPEHGADCLSQLADWDALVHPEDRAAVRDLRTSGRDGTLEYRLLAHDGYVRWYRETVATSAGNGDALQVWVVGIDITARHALEERLNLLSYPNELAATNRELMAEIAERRRAEHALRESERYNRMLFDSLPIGLALCRMNGEFVDFNAAFARIIGREHGDILNLTYWDITPPEHTAAERKQLELLERTERSGPYEKEFIHRDGHRVPVRLSGMVLRRGGERFIWSSVEDITEQRQAEEAKRASDKRYRSLFDTSRDGIKFTTLDGRIEDANRAYLDMIGYSLEELRATEYRKLTPLRWWPIESDIIANQVMRRGYSDEYEKEYIRKDGSVFPVQVRLWLVRDEHGKPARFFGIFRDITERKRHEHATRHRQAQLAHVSRLSTVGEMAAGLAHELNQPLSALTNYAHGCLRRIQSGSTQEDTLKTALEHITFQAARASAIIRRVRSFIGKDDQRHAHTDVNELVHHGVDMVDLDVRRHAVSVKLELADQLPQPCVDAVQIEQVIINLLLNASEAMRQSGIAHPTLTLQTAVQNGAVAVSVEDNGPGIDPAVVDQIFDPFFTTKQRGMGMGLSICRSIIEQHGGRLWADRAASGGAVFRLLLPTSEGVANHGQ